jgi:hypothetical protein
MIEIRKLDPHDPVPEAGRHVVLLRRFEEDDPRRIVLELAVARGHGAPQTRYAVHPDGTPMTVGEAVQAARRIAGEEQLERIYVIDRLAGPREQEILRHHGDHAFNMDLLQDFDLEDGVRGSDMRDRRPA